MKLYLMRHGDAEPFGPDKNRVLSAQGKHDITCLSHFLAPLKINVAHFFHSDKIRAIETASIMSAAIQSASPFVIRQELDSMASIQLLVDEIPALEGDTFLVGHMPYMGKLASFLTTGQEHLAHYAILPGTLLCFEGEPYQERWQLTWMLNPHQLLARVSP